MTNNPRVFARRKFLAKGFHTAAIVALSAELRPLFAASESRAFQIGACDWSIGQMCNTKAFDVARQIGLDGVQVSMGTVANDMQLRKPEVQQAYLDAAKRTEQGMASLAIGEMNRVPLKSDPRAAKWLDESVDVCRALGLDITMPACFGRGNLDMANTQEIDHVVGVLKDVAPKAEKAGVVIGLENYLSATDNLKIIERVGSPAVKVYYDVGNSTDKGYDIYKEIRQLGDRICQFHAKDGPHMLGKGRIDFRDVRKAIDAIDYRGWIIIEAAKPNGLLPDYQAHAKYLRTFFPYAI